MANPIEIREDELRSFRKEIDALIQKAKKAQDPRCGREMALAHTKLQEAKMWVGKCLEAIGSPFPENLRDEAEEK